MTFPDFYLVRISRIETLASIGIHAFEQAARHFNLHETLCGEILDLCLRQPGVLGAVVQTDKPDVYPGVAAVACRMGRMGPSLSGFPWWTLDV